MKNKKFFRFLRGELNGFYLKQMAYVNNVWMQKHIVPDLCYMKNVQFELGSMTEEDMFGIFRFAGVVQLLARGLLTKSALYMTVSEKVDKGNKPFFQILGETLNIDMSTQEISERGLFSEKDGKFDFSYWNSGKPDIVDNATTELQASLVPYGREPIGYIPEGGIIYDEFGNFTGRDIVTEKPTEGAYTDFYGEEFLHLSEAYQVYREIPVDILYSIFISTQYIRYNGSSVKSFAELTRLIVGDFVKLHSHIYDENAPQYVTWFYTEVPGKEVDDRIVRLDVWKNIVEAYFPQLRLEEVQ